MANKNAPESPGRFVLAPAVSLELVPQELVVDLVMELHL
jgi:hypothetical protein